MRDYPEEIHNLYGPLWLQFITDMETGWDELEPHQIVSHSLEQLPADLQELEAA